MCPIATAALGPIATAALGPIATAAVGSVVRGHGVSVCVGIHADKRVDTCIHVSVGMSMDMCITICVWPCVQCMAMYINMCIAMCTVYRHVYSHAYRHVYRHVYRQVFTASTVGASGGFRDPASAHDWMAAASTATADASGYAGAPSVSGHADAHLAFVHGDAAAEARQTYGQAPRTYADNDWLPPPKKTLIASAGAEPPIEGVAVQQQPSAEVSCEARDVPRQPMGERPMAEVELLGETAVCEKQHAEQGEACV